LLRVVVAVREGVGGLRRITFRRQGRTGSSFPFGSGKIFSGCGSRGRRYADGKHLASAAELRRTVEVLLHRSLPKRHASRVWNALASQMHVYPLGYCECIAGKTCGVLLTCCWVRDKYCSGDITHENCTWVHVSFSTETREGHVPRTCSARRCTRVLPELEIFRRVPFHDCRTSNNKAVNKSRQAAESFRTGAMVLRPP
jgi:hypothetical protein